jgi:uncharacterized protein YegL
VSLNEFVVSKPRPMPVFVLADTSGSMAGEKIQSLNSALNNMIGALAKVQDLRGQIQLAVITLGGQVDVRQPLAPVTEIVLPELEARGNTPMGAAFTLLREQIENPEVVPLRAFGPTVVLISDGSPTDLPAALRERLVNGTATKEDFLGWAPLAALHASERARKCVRLAMGIGRDADYTMLQAFLNNPDIPVIRAQDARGILKFFQWVTMSVTSRSVSRDPNQPTLSPPSEFKLDPEDVLF